MLFFTFQPVLQVTKSEIREKYRQKRAALSEEKIDALSLEIANNALNLPIWDRIYYHIFLSISANKEVQTDNLLHILQGRDKSVVVPKVSNDKKSLEHILLQENTKLDVSSMGIPEPRAGIEVTPESIEVVFVPLLAYDISGHRVGYGGGFYDRFLAKCSENTVFVGVSLFEPEPKVPSNSLDIPLDYCITANKIHSF